jgi:formylglycine-generating enzyme required for sulfatase activity
MRCNAWRFAVLLPVAMALGPLAAQDSATPLPEAGARAAHQRYTERIPGSQVRFTMEAVPGGDFLMGSPLTEKGRKDDEGPQHPVRVRPFWMGRCEVTWEEYDLFLAGGPTSDRDNEAALAKDADAITRPTPPYVDETYGFGREGGWPVVAISHHAAMEYCHWLSRKTGKTYRLPTEAEWEWACRAGTQSAYFFGADARDLDDYAWHAANSNDSTQRVAQKKPNPWGLCDIYGNVAEWCLDHYEADFYRGFPANRLTLGPVKLPSAARYAHVVRGGSYADDAARCRSAARRGSDASWNKDDPAEHKSIWRVCNADFVGFRVVRPVEDDELKGIRSKVTRLSR